MKTAIIILDSYKLPVFEKRLKDAGIRCVNKGEEIKGSAALEIQADTMEELMEWRPIIATINAEATK